MIILLGTNENLILEIDKSFSSAFQVSAAFRTEQDRKIEEQDRKIEEQDKKIELLEGKVNSNKGNRQ